MKKLLALVLAFAMLLSFSQAFAANSYPISLKGTTVIAPGQTTKWSANQWVWWTSGNPGVATIDQNGNIKALKAGVSNITATAANGAKKNVLLAVSEVNLAGKTAVYVGDSVKWTASVTPSHLNQWVSWTSGNPGVATVDKYGNIKALKAGKAHITATNAYGQKKTVTFIVYNRAVSQTSISLVGRTSLKEGTLAQWAAVVSPSGSNQWVWWTSGDPSVATIDQKGNIKALKAGKTNITATAANGAKKTVSLIVTENDSWRDYYSSYSSTKRLNLNEILVSYIPSLKVYSNNKYDEYHNLYDIGLLFKGTTSEFNITRNASTGILEISTGKPYTASSKYTETDSDKAYESYVPIKIDGKYIILKAYNADGTNYFALSDLANALGFKINSAEYSSHIRTKNSEFETTLDNTSYDGTAISITKNRWSSPKESYTYDNGNTYALVSAGNTINIKTYNKNTNVLVKEYSLKPELPIWGGFFSGAKYNYIVYGQKDIEETNKEVIRVVKYDKSFNRISSLSIYGDDAYTTIPFDAGTVSMAENGDELVVHTSRERHLTDDGKHHQSNLTLVINTSNMTLKNTLGAFQNNHVSHSFNQFVKYDSGNYVLLDHGDAYPRSIVLMQPGGKYNRYEETDLLKIPGAIGDNYTGVSVGGFEVTQTSYIVAINKDINFDSIGSNSGYSFTHGNIFILACNKQTKQTTQVALTSYPSNTTASDARLVKISDNRLVIMWHEFELDEYKYSKSSKFKYAVIDGNGKIVSAAKELRGVTLSEDCQPVVINNNIMWFVDSLFGRILYKIPVSTIVK